MSDIVWQVLVVVLLLLAALNAVVTIGLMRQVGVIVLQIGPPRAGDLDEGPEVGEVLDLPELGPPERTMLMFLSPGCPGCESLVPAIPTAIKAYPEVRFVAAITYGDDDARAAYARKLGPVVRRDLDNLHDRVGVPGTPFVIALDDENRVVRAGVANNLGHLEALADSLLAPKDYELDGSSNGSKRQGDQVMEVEFASPGGSGGN